MGLKVHFSTPGLCAWFSRFLLFWSVSFGLRCLRCLRCFFQCAGWSSFHFRAMYCYVSVLWDLPECSTESSFVEFAVVEFTENYFLWLGRKEWIMPWSFNSGSFGALLVSLRSRGVPFYGFYFTRLVFSLTWRKPWTMYTNREVIDISKLEVLKNPDFIPSSDLKVLNRFQNWVMQCRAMHVRHFPFFSSLFSCWLWTPLENLFVVFRNSCFYSFIFREYANVQFSLVKAFDSRRHITISQSITPLPGEEGYGLW